MHSWMAGCACIAEAEAHFEEAWMHDPMFWELDLERAVAGLDEELVGLVPDKPAGRLADKPPVDKRKHTALDTDSP